MADEAVHHKIDLQQVIGLRKCALIMLTNYTGVKELCPFRIDMT